MSASDRPTRAQPPLKQKVTINWPECTLSEAWKFVETPPTRVHPQESSVDFVGITALSGCMRFGTGLSERQKWLRALPKLDMPYKQRLAYQKCGDHPCVEIDDETSRVRLKTYTCKSRFCPACRKQRRWRWRRTVVAALDHLPTEQWQLITLTLKSDMGSLKDQLEFLRKSFRRLRQTHVWRSKIKWGLAVIEITINQETELWHPHLHILAPCRFIDYTLLRKAWRKATGGSHIIDGLKITNTDRAARYLAKYLGKPPSDFILENEELLNDYYVALRNAKMLLPFGDYPEAAKPTKPEPSLIKWKFLGTLESVLKLARDNWEPAKIVIAQLSAPMRHAAQQEPRLRQSHIENLLTVVLDPIPPDP